MLNITSQTILILFISLICFVDVIAQKADTTRIKIEDGWIEIMSSKIAMDVSLNNSYEIFEARTSTNKFILYPNATANLRFKLN